MLMLLLSQSDKVMYVVTECVTPLEMWINANQDNSVRVHLAISWGLHQVAVSVLILYFMAIYQIVFWHY